MGSVIIAWSGTIASIPSQAKLCDGTSDPMDLRDRFVAGKNPLDVLFDTLKMTGGADTKNFVAHDHSIASHSHTGGAATTSANPLLSSGPGTVTISRSDHTHSATFATSSSDAATTDPGGSYSSVENRPAYYALAYIRVEDIGLPIGTIALLDGESAPEGWLVCDGTNGTLNLKGVMAKCKNAIADAAASGGDVDAVMPAHTHVADHTHTENVSLPASGGTTTASSSGSGNAGNTPAHTHSASRTSGSATVTSGSDASASVSNMPKYVVLNYIQKVFNSVSINTLSSETVDPATCEGRLTPVTGTPELNQYTAYALAPTLYWSPHTGSRISLHDGIDWHTYDSAETSLPLTNVMTGILNSTTVVTGLVSTAQLVVGMKISGTGIPANTVISSINSRTQITMNNAATASGSYSLTFVVPSGAVYDVFMTDNAKTPAMRFGPAWTNNYTRAIDVSLFDGVYTLFGDPTMKWLGTIYASTDGNTRSTYDAANGLYQRFVWNYYNQLTQVMLLRNTTGSWTYTSATWRVYQGGTTNYIAEWVSGLPTPRWMANNQSTSISVTAERCGTLLTYYAGGTNFNKAWRYTVSINGGYDGFYLNWELQNDIYDVVGYQYMQQFESSLTAGTMTTRGNGYYIFVTTLG